MIISIDIGTSYSSICMNGPDGKARPVDIRTGVGMYGSDYSLPSAVFVEDNGKVLVGQAAMNSMKRKPQNFRMEFKRDIGQDIPIFLGNNKFMPEDFYTEIFRYMIECVKKISGESIEKVYLTCPAAFGKNKKEKIIAAAKAAGLFQAELVDEPTAAAMSYCAEGFLKDDQKLMVYDFGGGTFDVSLIHYKDGTFQRLTEPHGLERCGGIDMDRLIYQDMLSCIDVELLEQINANSVSRMRLDSQLAELTLKAKHHLSVAERFEEDIQIGLVDMVPYELTVKKFNGMVAGLVGQTITACREILRSAGLQVADLSSMLMVGGTSRVPLVKEMVKQFAGDVPVLYSDDLELAVVKGALNFHTYQPQCAVDVNDKDAEQRKKSAEDVVEYFFDEEESDESTAIGTVSVRELEEDASSESLDKLPPTPDSEFEFREVDGGYEVYAYRGARKIVSIPSQYNGRPVVIIGRLPTWSFEKVIIPASCHIIKDMAFRYILNLSEVIFLPGAQIEEIGSSAFDSCCIQKVNIPANCRLIKHYAFSNNGNLSEVIFQPNAQIEEIEGNAFADCNIKKISIPVSCHIIGFSAFARNKNLSDVMFPPNARIEEIEGNAFAGCNIKKVNIPANCRIIGRTAFRGNSNLSDVIFPPNAQIESLDEYAFVNSNVQSIKLPASCKCDRLWRDLVPPGIFTNRWVPQNPIAIERY